MKRALLPLLALAGAAQAQNQSFVLESAVIDSRSGANLGVSTERGEVASLFRAQKALTFGILRSAGIDLNALPPDVRARIERFQTTNLEAFRAYSNGLDLKDQGRFAEAGEQFRRAAELDPNFGLASEQQQAMPEITLNAAVQLRAALATSAGQAVSRGQNTVVVDAQRAIAAAQSGLVVTQGRAAPTDVSFLEKGYQDEYAGSGTGSGDNVQRNLATATAFGLGGDLRIAVSGEWKGTQFRTEGGQLLGAGEDGKFLLQRDKATPVPGGSLDLADGTRVYWGQWMSSANASAVVQFENGTKVVAPALGAVDWIAADATRQLPGTGTATFTPAGGGNLTNVSGSIAVDFQLRSVALNNLGFTLDGLSFSGLQGTATMRPGSLSGLFNGNYSVGSCAGCTGFVPGSSSFGGNFLGRNADGLLFSTILVTEPGSTKGGVTVLKKEP